MEGRVGAIPSDHDWSSDRPKNHPAPRKKKPADEPPAPPAPDEDYYTPSEPPEES